MSVTCFVLGYGTWEILLSSNPSHMHPNRLLCYIESQPLAESILRLKSFQVIIVGLPCSHGFSPRPENFDGCNFVGLYMGVVCVPLPSQHTPSRL